MRDRKENRVNKSGKAPTKLVRLTKEELRKIGYGTLGRFPTSDIYTTAQNDRIRREGSNTGNSD
jgi:hypothetical protein